MGGGEGVAKAQAGSGSNLGSGYFTRISEVAQLMDCSYCLGLVCSLQKSLLPGLIMVERTHPVMVRVVLQKIL